MISERLKRVICDALDLADFAIEDETKAFEIPGWDSLNHVRVILAVEREFGIHLKGTEVLRLRNIGELQALVHGKVAATGSKTQ